MENKLFFFSLLIFFLNLELSYQKNNNNNNYNDNDKINVKESSNLFESNPYLVLGIPPWTKYESVKKRYKKLKERFKSKNKINSLEFKSYKEAYERITKDFEENNYQDKSFLGVVKATIKKLFIYELILFAFLFFTWAIYRFSSFATFLVIVFVSVDNIIPHLFSSISVQYIFSFCLAIFLYFGNSLFCKSKEDKDNDDNAMSNGKKRTRRRFEKYE